MNGLTWTMLILAALIGAILFAAIGTALFTLLLASVSGRLGHADEARHGS